MSDGKHPLDDVFDMDSGMSSFEDEIMSIDIPNDPRLDDITRLALQAYKDAMMDLPNIEPRFRSRHQEVTQQYLNIAKDAMAKRIDLDLKSRKLDMEEDKKKEVGKKSGSGMSRAEIQKMAGELKVVDNK